MADIKNIDDFWAIIKKRDEGYELASLAAEFNMTGDEPHEFLAKLFDYYMAAKT